MKKNVDVNVTGIHSRPGEPTEKIVTSSAGLYEIMDDGSKVLEYDEEQDTGNGAVHIHNRVHIAPDGSGMEITRGGDMNSKLAFGKELEYDTEYVTPYGTMQMRVVTTSFDFINIRHEEEVKLMAEYELEMGGEVLSDSMIIIEIKNAETV
jgi:uncharacterized beta-barrel protein YwiB (DUF1934 family)